MTMIYLHSEGIIMIGGGSAVSAQHHFAWKHLYTYVYTVAALFCQKHRHPHRSGGNNVERNRPGTVNSNDK